MASLLVSNEISLKNIEHILKDIIGLISDKAKKIIQMKDYYKENKINLPEDITFRDELVCCNQDK